MAKNPRSLSIKYSGQELDADTLFLSIGDGAVSTDEEGRINRINQPALKMLGLQEDDALGRWFPQVLIACDNQGQRVNPLVRPITQTFLTGKPVSEKTFYQTKNGSLLPVAVNVAPITVGNRPVGAIEVFRDITREEEVDRAKSEFISLASHQLRTPLSAINTYANMLADGYAGKLTKMQIDYMKIIMRSANRMNQLIDSLLNIAHLEEGRLKVSYSSVDPALLVKDIISEIKPAAKEKGLKLKVSTTKDLKVRTDAVLVKDIFVSLIGNAIKYTPSGGRVSITCEAMATRMVFKVEDTGYGIPEALQRKVFTKFFRADNIVQYDTEGSGLGLYMTKQIANRLHGHLWFDSVAGEGTIFYFSLPLESVDKISTGKASKK